jgi:hypothetical protein
MSYIWTSLLSCVAYISGVRAQDTFTINEADIKMDAGSIVGAIILWILGLAFIFSGKRIIKILLFIVGFIFFGLFSLFIATNIVDTESITSSQRIGIIVGSVIAAILGGMLSWYLYKLGIAILGFLMGFSIGSFVVHRIPSLETHFWTRFGIMVASGFAIAILAIFLMKLMIIISTSFVGSQMAMIGVDLIINQGYSKFILIYIKSKAIQVTPVLWVMLGSSIILTLIGILFQWKAYSKKEYYDNKGNKV